MAVEDESVSSRKEVKFKCPHKSTFKFPKLPPNNAYKYK